MNVEMSFLLHKTKKASWTQESTDLNQTLWLRKYLSLCNLCDFLWRCFVSFCDRIVGPCLQCTLMGTRWLQSLWSIVLGIIVRPLLTSAGRCCGGFSIHLAKEWDSHIRSTSRLVVCKSATVFTWTEPKWALLFDSLVYSLLFKNKMFLPG